MFPFSRTSRTIFSFSSDDLFLWLPIIGSSLDYILEEENDFIKSDTIKIISKFTSRAMKHYTL
jgi:hypothetical protein